MDGSLRIGELARRTGVSTHALRVWEERYQLLTPQRAANGYRAYTVEDEQRVRGMVRLRAQGVGAAAAAGRVLDAALGRSRPTELEVLLGDLLAAFSGYDEARAQTAMDLALVGHPIDQILDRVFFPALRHLGDAWEKGEISVAQEHYASGLIRARMMGLGSATPSKLTAEVTRRAGGTQGSAGSAVLACTPHEQHDIGLLALNLLLRVAGWRVTFLGADTPVESAAILTEELGADVLVLCGSEPRMFAAQLEHHASALRDLPATLAVAGRAAGPAVADRLGAVLLASGPAEAVDVLSAGRHGPARGRR
ncbi:MAG: MerR family transcriptional regulator [Marmoricola sp.]